MVTFDIILTFGPCVEREYSLKVLIDTQSFLSMSGQTIPFPVGQGQPHQQGPTVGTLGTWSVPTNRSPSESSSSGSHLFPRIPGNRPV